MKEATTIVIIPFEVFIKTKVIFIPFFPFGVVLVTLRRPELYSVVSEGLLFI